MNIMILFIKHFVSKVDNQMSMLIDKSIVTLEFKYKSLFVIGCFLFIDSLQIKISI